MPSMLGRRATLALGAAALARPAIAQAGYPARPIRMYVPWGAGGTTDVQMRALCDAASRRIGQRWSSTTSPAPAASSAPRPC